MLPTKQFGSLLLWVSRWFKLLAMAATTLTPTSIFLESKSSTVLAKTSVTRVRLWLEPEVPQRLILGLASPIMALVLMHMHGERTWTQPRLMLQELTTRFTPQVSMVHQARHPS